MPQIQPALPIGAVIQKRYRVEKVLGKGGFSAVYLLKDLQNGSGEQRKEGEPKNGKLFALKELVDQDEEDLARFAFECEILKRLEHPALPHVYQVFENGASHRAYMLMDYVDGLNLNLLRQEQPGKRFSWPQVLNIMAPIVDAIAYLHRQQPPIIHRDIKPANIVVPTKGDRAVLVDFGIAKEYDSEGTTTAVRHCSPGYSAPEQYGTGSNLRTDIYGLGATFYTLLTGAVPVDALHRMTQVGNRAKDPLIPVNQLAPSVPLHIVEAIQRALSLGSVDRFPTVEAFWQALNSDTEKQASSETSRLVATQSTSASETELSEPLESPTPVEPVTPVAQYATTNAPSASSKRQLVPLRSSKFSAGVLVLVLLALFLIIGLAFSRGVYTMGYRSPTSVPSTPLATRAATVSTSPVTSNLYPIVNTTYQGVLHDLSTDVTSNIALTQIHQNNQSISGYFSSSQVKSTFTGVLDTSKHIFFTVTGNSGQPSLFFEGAVRADGNLAGNYCSIDQQGQCSGNYGVWSLAPM